MVLYDDLRIYTALHHEAVEFHAFPAAQSGHPAVENVYKKTGAEWEIYGQLAERLLHPIDALDAYKLAMSQYVSTKSIMNLIRLQATSDIHTCLDHIIELINLGDRSFVEHTYPSYIGKTLFGMIKTHGLVKIQNIIIAMNIPPNSFRSISRYFEYAEVFQCEGSDW